MVDAVKKSVGVSGRLVLLLLSLPFGVAEDQQNDFELTIDCTIYPGLLDCRQILPQPDVQIVNEVLQEYLVDMKWFGDSSGFALGILESDADVLFDDLLRPFNVTNLILARTKISRLPPKFVMQMESEVTALNLIGNDIGHFDWLTLRTVPFGEHLQSLCISYSDMDDVDWQTLQHFANLEEIDLSGNLLTTLPKRVFDGLHRLARVDLSGNQLLFLEAGTFYDLPSLVELNLAFNSLFQIQNHAFAYLDNLSFLSVQGNILEQIEAMAFNEWHQPKLTHIDLRDNPFNCNCDLLWLKQWLIQRQILEDSEAFCLIPDEKPFGEVNFCPQLVLEIEVQNMSFWA